MHAWIITGIVTVVGSGVLVSHIREDRARYRQMIEQAEKFERLRAEVRKFVDEAREKLK